MSNASSFRPPGPSRQLAFHQFLIAARTTLLHDALLEALDGVDPNIVADELRRCAPLEARRTLARSGIRDELVFMTPSLLQHRPTLFGYYRLLLGVSGKEFYRSGTGFSRFRSLEERNKLTSWHRERLWTACEAMNQVLGELVLQVSPTITDQDIRQLPLLTLGSQFQGANNTRIGKQATQDVFLAIREILESRIVEETERSLVVSNASHRKVVLALAADPDVTIVEDFGGESQLNVAIEIKGGTDSSNAHNRAGEAEKSHQKVRSRTGDFWTLIAMKGVDVAKLKSESPTTTEWFDISEVLARDGDHWKRFRYRVVGAVGVPLDEEPESAP